MSLCRPQGIGKVFCNGSISVKVFQKVLHSDYFSPRSGSGGGGRGGSVPAITGQDSGVPNSLYRNFVAVERAYATDIPLFICVKESKVSDGIEGICSAPNGPDYVKLR